MTVLKLMLRLSYPRRILAVTGTSTERFIARTISPHLTGSFISKEPEPLRRTFATGHPMFTSMRSMLGLYCTALAAAWANLSGLLPNNCRPVGWLGPNLT